MYSLRVILISLCILCAQAHSAVLHAQSVSMYYTGSTEGYFDGKLLRCNDGGLLHFEPGLNSNNWILTRLDSSNTFLWQKEIVPVVQSVAAHDICLLPDSGFLVAGARFNTSALFIQRYSESGDTVWSRQFQFNGSGTNIKKIVMLSPSRYMLVGTTNITSGPQGMFLMKFDVDGNAEAPLILSPGANGFFTAAAIMNSDGNIAFCATSPPGSAYFGIIDTNGTILNAVRYQLLVNQFSFHNMLQLSDQSYVLLGSGAFYEDIYLQRIDSVGNLMQQYSSTQSPGLNRGKSMLNSSTGGFYLAAEQTSSALGAYGGEIIRFNDTLGIESESEFVGYCPNGIAGNGNSLIVQFYGYDPILMNEGRVYVETDSIGQFPCNSQPQSHPSLGNAMNTMTSSVYTSTIVAQFSPVAFPTSTLSFVPTVVQDYCLFTNSTNQEMPKEVPLVYPNPASECITLTTHMSTNTYYEITDTKGKLMKSGSIGADRNIIVDDLSSGLYIISLYYDSSIAVYGKFIKE